MCRIGQNDRCSKTGCEFYKVFGLNCEQYSFCEKVIIVQEENKFSFEKNYNFIVTKYGLNFYLFINSQAEYHYH